MQNNVFCTLRNRYRNHILNTVSGGLLDVHVSKKTLKYITKIIVLEFNKGTITIKIFNSENKKFMNVI